MHQTDPTISTFTIITKEKGDFNHILDLVTLTTHSIPANEIPDSLRRHEQFHHLYGNQIECEIEYLSSHFYELCNRFFNELKTLSIDTIEKVVSNASLKHQSEDQLLKFANDLYQDSTNPNRREYSIVYDHVLFENVGQEKISEFVDHFNKNDISEETWRRLSTRLKQTVTSRQTNHQSQFMIFRWSEKTCEKILYFSNLFPESLHLLMDVKRSFSGDGIEIMGWSGKKNSIEFNMIIKSVILILKI